MFTFLQRCLATYLRLYREALTGLPRATWLLAAVTLVHRAGTMVTPFFALYFARELDLGDTAAGWLLSLFGLGGAAGAYLGGWLSDRIGAARLLAISLVATGSGFLLIPLFRTQAELEIVLPIFGVIAFAFRPAAAAAIAASCLPDTRAQAFAFQRLVINLGMGIGPVIGGKLAKLDYGLLFWVDGTVCVLAGLAVFALRGAIAAPPPQRAGEPSAEQLAELGVPAERSPFRDGLFLLIVLNTFILAFIGFQWWSTGPVFLKDEYGMDEEGIGYVIAINPILIVLFEVVLVRSIHKQRPLPWIGLAGLLLAVSCALLPLGSTFGWAVLVMVVWTTAEMLESPLSGAFVATRASTKRLGQYMGLYAFSFSLAMGLAPGVGLWVYERWGSDTLWIGSAVIAAIAAAGVLTLAWVTRPSRRAAASGSLGR